MFNQTVRAVCQDCNNGWMSALENSVKGFLGPMILDGQHTRLSRHNQRQLASWTLKTILIAQCLHAENKRVIPDSVYKEFYAAQDPGDNHLIWLGYRGILDKDHAGSQLIAAAQIGPLYEFSVPARMPEKRKQEFQSGTFYIGTLVLGRVALQLFGHDLRSGFNLTRNTQRALSRIWKVESHVLWPLSSGIEVIGGFEGLHESLKPPRQ